MKWKTSSIFEKLLACVLLASSSFGADGAVCTDDRRLDRAQLRDQYRLPPLSQLAEKAGIHAGDKIIDVRTRCKDSLPIYEFFYLDEQGVVHHKDLYLNPPPRRASHLGAGRG